MNKIVLIIVAMFFATFSFADEQTKQSFTDDMMFSVTVERGMESELQYGYFYATKPWTDKFSTTYSASFAIDSPTSEPMLDMYSQTLNLSYQLTDSLSVYMLNDINPHFERTETWVGSTYVW